MKKVVWSVRIDSELKKELKKVCKEMGVSMSAAMTDVLKEIVEKQEITFMTDKRRRELLKSQRKPKRKL